MFKSILVGTDGSPTANSAVAEAVRLAQSLDARLLLVSAYAPVSNVRQRQERHALPEDAQWMVGPREDVLGILEEAEALAKREGLDGVQTFAREGEAADAILDVAEEHGADLIIVGNKGMTGAKRFLLGSVPDKISHHAPCSVLIIRTT
jgi:nucleotide-binding universal stress UspA family protein